MKLLDKKVLEAKKLIKKALNKHKNRIYVAYSGGKDSQALLKLVKEIQSNNVIVHNRHPKEKISNKINAVITKKPKAKNMRLFLSCVEIKAQFDGTRKDEDKTVMFNSKEIHRSKMPSNYTKKGVFGLEVYFPLFKFTKEDVYEYLREK